jgi:hypothetical protein
MLPIRSSLARSDFDRHQGWIIGIVALTLLLVIAGIAMAQPSTPGTDLPAGAYGGGNSIN